MARFAPICDAQSKGSGELRTRLRSGCLGGNVYSKTLNFYLSLQTERDKSLILSLNTFIALSVNISS